MAKNKDKKKVPFNVFRKGITAGALGLAMLLGGAGMLTACGEKGDRGDTGASGKSAYELAVEQGFQGTLTEWLESLKGQSGGSGSAGNDGVGIASIEKTGTNGLVDTYTITFTNGTTTTFTITNGENGTTPSAPEVTINAQGYWVINGTPTSTLATAEDGKTPYIEGEYWYIDGVSTGVKAQGAQGNDGKSAFDLYKEENPTYTGTLSDWLETLKGQDGTDGTMWFTGTLVTGTGDSIAKEVTGSKVGDLYLNTSTSDIYECTATNTWRWITNIKGAKGDEGETGSDGINGSSWLSGTTAPSINLGKDGDTYLDITTNYVYTKINGTWTKIGLISGDRDVTIQTESAWAGKTAVFVGDSITYGSGCDGDKYWEVLEDLMGFSQVTGMGVGGSCFSVTSDYGTNNQPLINRYQNIPEADLIQIFMGTNDYGHGTPLGSIEDTTDVSFYGALNVILPALQQKYPNSRIVVCTPLHRYGRNASANVLTYDYLPHPVTGKTLADYVNAMKEVCERLSIPVIDLFNISGINPTLEVVREMYMPDGLHPNTAGHKQIANIMKYHLDLYAIDSEEVVVTPSYELELKIGNAFSTDAATQSNNKRATTSNNIYLEKGTTISVVNSSLYNIAVYRQESAAIVASTSISGGYVDEYTTEEDGWYGFVLSQDDADAVFNFSSMSKEFYNYVDITLPLPAGALMTGNQYGGSPYSEDATRASVVKNIYFDGSATLVVKNSNDYKFAVYSQSGETLTQISSLTGGFVTNYTITEPGWYGFVIANQKSEEFDFSSSVETIYDYIEISFIEELDLSTLSMITGNQFDANYVSDSSRASASKNVYLTAGSIISLKNENYLFGVFEQTGEELSVDGECIQAWTAEDYIISADGWYGLTFANKDKTTIFDFNSVPSIVGEYITITQNVEEPEDVLEGLSLISGNKYDENYINNDTRASASGNVYLTAGTVISIKDSAYMFGVFTQTSETQTVGGQCIQAWTVENYTITTSGWYGLAFKKANSTSFDFTSDPTNVSDYITIA